MDGLSKVENGQAVLEGVTYPQGVVAPDFFLFEKTQAFCRSEMSSAELPFLDMAAGFGYNPYTDEKSFDILR